MKIILVFFSAIVSLHLNAQSDSLKKIRFSGLQLKFNLVGSRYDESARENYQSFIKTNEILNQDVAGYSHSPNSGTHNYSSYIALGAVADIRTRKKFPRLELVLGLNYGQSILSSASYTRKDYDTTGSYYNSVKNEVLYTVNENNSSYLYEVRSQQLLLPVGINLVTNKKRRIWVSAGLELSPGISFANVFSARKGLYTSELILYSNSRYSDITSYTRTNQSQGKWESAETKFDGVGFAGFVTLPLSVNLRLAKRINFLKHMSLSASISPGFYYSNNKFSGTNSGTIMNSALGLRYSW
ncbi:MAG: hypothetical protein V4635_05335 [Bacteroidota bacterium]